LRRKARGRPQMLQRLRCWVENLGFLFVLAIFAVVAIVSFAKYQLPNTKYRSYCLNGMPNCLSSARAWLSSRAVVTMVTFMPFSLSTFA
jgi:hypothetical protein